MMTELLTAEQMRETERAAIESGKVTGLELMERAGQGAVEAIFAEWPELRDAPHRAVVLCGPGNNGGDGFVVARLLKERGWDVEVFLYGDADKLPPDARTNFERWGTAVRTLDNRTVEDIPLDVDDPDAAPELVIDALFGIGLTRPFELWNVPDTLDAIAGSEGHTRVVALDIPSGFNADTGIWVGQLEEGVFPSAADLTLTFHAAKPAHYLGDAPQRCGALRVVDIGLSSEVGMSLCPAPPKWQADKRNGHKFDHGHALVLSGGVGEGGAARMAARGALRIGAGLVTVGCPPAALIENAAQLNAIMLRSVTGGDALAEMLADARINVLCLGPGLGTGAQEAGLVRAALGARRDEDVGLHPPHVVLDGDALTVLATEPDLFKALHDRCVLTPHGGEFARLFPDLSERLSENNTYSKVDATRNAAARAGCVIVFKGPDTVIATPDGRAAIHAAAYDRAAPWLATAGSGDVLAGFVTGLLAREFAAFDAACTAAWLHTECALEFGPGLIAEDLPEILPQVLRAL